MWRIMLVRRGWDVSIIIIIIRKIYICKCSLMKKVVR